MQQSPLVVKQNWTWDGTSIGRAQVTDAFQRAEFWKYAQPAGINPTYNVNLSSATASPITINVAAGVQTYGWAMYDNSGAFSGSADISALSHEAAGWQNDPYDTDPTPSWGKIGQVTGCQANLEVGDPLSGTTYTDTVGRVHLSPAGTRVLLLVLRPEPEPGRERLVLRPGHIQGARGCVLTAPSQAGP